MLGDRRAARRSAPEVLGEAPELVASRGRLANPEALDWFVELARRRTLG